MHRICHRSHPTFVSSCRKHSTNLYSLLCAAHLLLYAQNTYRFHRRGPLVHIYIADAHILFQKYKIYTPRSKPYHTCAACEYHLKKSVIPARETKHYSASIAENISVLAETPPPKMSRSKPCLLARYATDHLNTSLRGSSGNALVDIFSGYFLHCRTDSPAHPALGAKIVPDAPKK